MMMSPVVMVVMMTTPTVCATLGLEGGVHRAKFRAKAKEHMLDDMVRADAKRVMPDFGGQMAISQMPGETYKLMRLFVPHFDNRLGRGLNFEPPSIFQLQTISIRHGNGLWKIEKDILALIRSKANAASMPRVKIQSKRACRLFLRPMPGWSMSGSTVNWNTLHSDLNT
jgi:hypothetical protein